MAQPTTRKYGETVYNTKTGIAEGTVKFDAATGKALQEGQVSNAYGNAFDANNGQVIKYKSPSTISVDGINQPDAPITVPPPPPSTAAAGLVSSIKSSNLSNAAKFAADNAAQAQADTKTGESDINTIFKGLMDVNTEQSTAYDKTGVNAQRDIVNNTTSQIEAEQNNLATRIEELKKNSTGMTAAALQSETDRITNDSLTRQAKLSITNSAATRNYTALKADADAAITAKTDNLKLQLQQKSLFLQHAWDTFDKNEQRVYDITLKDEQRTADSAESLQKQAVSDIQELIKDEKITPEFGATQIGQILDGKPLSEIYRQIGVVGSGNPGIVAGYDISKYATDPNHEIAIKTIYDSLGDITDEKSATEEIKSRSLNSPITGGMVMYAAQTNHVDAKMIVAIMAQDSSMGTKGMGARNKNPGNIGQFDSLKMPVGGFKTWGEGVNAVGQWLAKHKATGIYNNEFGATITQIAQLGNGTDKSKEAAELQMQNAIASKDYKSAYQLGVNRIGDQLPTAEEKSQFNAKLRAIPAAESLKVKLQAYADAGGNTGLLKGTAEDIQAKLGNVKDEKLRALATELKIAFQTYRKDMSGAAFSTAESADYASVNPSSKNKLSLNMAILDGMISSFQGTVDSTIMAKAPGLIYIRDYAKSGTYPGKNIQAPITTPGGNSYTVE